MPTVQEQNKAISRRWREELDKGNWGPAGEFVSPNFILHAPGSPPMNREGAMQMIKAFYGAFPDLHHVFDGFVAEGDKVALRFTLVGTHKGDLQGIPATGRTVNIAGSVVDRIVDGKIVEHWSLLDTMGMMQQLGVIPAPAQSGG